MPTLTKIQTSTTRGIRSGAHLRALVPSGNYIQRRNYAVEQPPKHQSQNPGGPPKQPTPSNNAAIMGVAGAAILGGYLWYAVSDNKKTQKAEQAAAEAAKTK